MTSPWHFTGHEERLGGAALVVAFTIATALLALAYDVAGLLVLL